ncbi:MAG TPA: LacI family DNA-binding transcriptional regulator [Gaiellaceae bacterium]|nr:LacI family DNA-binding transcriptional regulator [Gaiellaceae bacterium]
MDGRKPVTMARIAERAGVALSTVSYVLSGKRSVSEEMRARVLAAVEELDYRPHGPARALASRRSHTVALFLPSRQWHLVPIQQTFVAGANQATSAMDYALLLSTSPEDPDTIARLLTSGRADGVILMETLAHDPRVERLKAGGYPFSLIGRTADTTGISFVDLDFGDAVRRSLAHLAELGHTCIALFNFPQDLVDAGYTSALIARDAFEESAAQLGIRGIQLPCPHVADEALSVAAQLLNTEPECTAAITTGWQFTGLLGALRAAALHVPDDFSIVSVIASQFAEMLTPALTGIEWPAFDAGRLAAEMLIERLGNADLPPRQLLIGGELVVRETTGPARPPARVRAIGKR